VLKYYGEIKDKCSNYKENLKAINTIPAITYYKNIKYISMKGPGKEIGPMGALPLIK
jgi:hypothetical protein